jgi:hypothetical protein
MRLKLTAYLLLLTIQLGYAGVPLFGNQNSVAKGTRNTATEKCILPNEAPQF